MKLFSVKEIIEYAIDIEKESFAFYTQAAKQVADKDVNELVKMLAEEEVEHQNRLRRLIDEKTVSVSELQKKYELDTTLMDKIVNTPAIDADATALDVLKIALEREKNTQQTYKMLMTLSNIDENVVEIFKELRQQEQGHANKIQFRIDHLGT